MDKFIFWGLFLAIGFIVVGYVIWMYWVNKNNEE